MMLGQELPETRWSKVLWNQGGKKIVEKFETSFPTVK